MDITSLHNEFKQSAKEVLRGLEVTQLSNEAELILENMINSATQTLLEDRKQNLESDDVFNEKVNNALQQIKVLISKASDEEIQIFEKTKRTENIKGMASVPGYSELYVLRDVKRISANAFHRVINIFCPVYPLC